MWVDLAIVLDPVGEFGKDGGCVGQDGHPGVISFQGLHEASDILRSHSATLRAPELAAPPASGERTGVKSRVRPRAAAVPAVGLAM